MLILGYDENNRPCPVDCDEAGVYKGCTFWHLLICAKDKNQRDEILKFVLGHESYAGWDVIGMPDADKLNGLSFECVRRYKECSTKGILPADYDFGEKNLVLLDEPSKEYITENEKALREFMVRCGRGGMRIIVKTDPETIPGWIRAFCNSAIVRLP